MTEMTEMTEHSEKSGIPGFRKIRARTYARHFVVVGYTNISLTTNIESC